MSQKQKDAISLAAMVVVMALYIFVGLIVLSYTGAP